jgi:hypothetical protein
MPDISMCKGAFCPIYNKCYRFTATPSQYHQSYLTTSPYDLDKEECEYFWDNGETKDD